MASKPLHAAILASGQGSNAENIARFCQKHPGSIVIDMIVTDNPQAGVIARAKNLGIPCHVIPKEGAKRAHEDKILSVLEGVEWLFLAGYMRLVTPEFLKPFYDVPLDRNRVVNIHPSLLPAFPGIDAYEQAFAAGVETSGVTLHFVDDGMDTGPVIAQKSFARLPGDTLDDFRARGMALEYEIYVEFLETLIGTGAKKWARR